jgi:hypothetical protein
MKPVCYLAARPPYTRQPFSFASDTQHYRQQRLLMLPFSDSRPFLTSLVLSTQFSFTSPNGVSLFRTCADQLALRIRRISLRARSIVMLMHEFTIITLHLETASFAVC